MRRLAIAGSAAGLAALTLMGAAQAQEDACAAFTTYAPPPEGTVITFETRDDDGDVLGSSESHEIGASDGDLTAWERYQLFAQFQGQAERSPPRLLETRGGLFNMSSLPSGDYDGDRRYAYEDDPVALMLALEPGESAITVRIETSSMNNRTRTIRGPLVISLEGCGTVDVNGTDEPVHFYRLSMESRSYMPGRRPQADTTITTEMVVALSDRLGWPIEYASGRYTVRAVDITLPDSEGEGGSE